ncbi:MAG: class I SAM-dependent methyltransferase [Acidimicrobiales bacterium]
MTTPTAEQAKACCAAAYGADVVTLLLGESYHPGGLALTRHLATHLALPPGAQVLDVASGRGATAMLLAQEFGLTVAGVDLSAANVALAQGAADAAGTADRVTYGVGDAEQLPYGDATFDAVVVECALCIFPDKPAAVSEIARVLRPGGRLGLTDVIAEPDRLPAELATFAARVACVAGALPMHGYVDTVEAAGMRVTRTERHDTALLRMIDQIEARLTVVRLTTSEVTASGLDLTRIRSALAAARAAFADGVLGYGLLTATKPVAR